MASKPETTFYTGVHKHLPPKLYRMKTFNPYIGGPWDFWFSGRDSDLWVEDKFVVLPKREETLIDINLSGLQLNWGKERLAEGRNLAVIVGCKEGGLILLNQEWEESLCRAEFAERLRSRAETARWITETTGGPP
jgi:hypothetical protein